MSENEATGPQSLKQMLKKGVMWKAVGVLGWQDLRLG